MEYLLSALSGCMTTTMALHAAARDIEIESIESRIEGDLDVEGFLGLNDQVRKRYLHIRVTFVMKENLAESQKKELIGFAKKSPVHDDIINGTRVDLSLAN